MVNEVDPYKYNESKDNLNGCMQETFDDIRGKINSVSYKKVLDYLCKKYTNDRYYVEKEIKYVFKNAVTIIRNSIDKGLPIIGIFYSEKRLNEEYKISKKGNKYNKITHAMNIVGYFPDCKYRDINTFVVLNTWGIFYPKLDKDIIMGRLSYKNMKYCMNISGKYTIYRLIKK